MRVAMLSTFANVTVDLNNHKGIEAKYLSKLLEQSGVERVDYIGTAGRTNKNVPTYRHWEEVHDLDSYDKLFLQLSTANFFGGTYDDRVDWLIATMGKIDPKKIYILPTDPRIPMISPAQAVFDRFKNPDAADMIEDWEAIIEDAWYVSPGPDITKFIGHEPLNWFWLPWFLYVHANCLWYYEPLETLQDVCYWGAKRGKYRETQIRHFLGDDRLKVRLVGYDCDETSAKTRFYKRVAQQNLHEHIRHCKTSLIIGDEEHENNVITFRLWEAIAGGSMPAIASSFDPQRTLEMLLGFEGLLYVDGPEDILNYEHSPETIKALQVCAAQFLTNAAQQMSFEGTPGWRS